MNNLLPMLIQLTEKDKRLLIALFILLIVVFVLIAYIGNGIKALMRNYSKGIDGYMHDLCKSGLIENPKKFREQVYVRETKFLYIKTRWAFRAVVIITIGLIVYAFVAKPTGNETFAFFTNALDNLKFKFEWPKGEFFGIKNFPIDWPVITQKPSPKFDLPSIVTYLSIIGYIYSIFIVSACSLRFIARINRARIKSEEVFNKSLDNFEIDGVDANGEK